MKNFFYLFLIFMVLSSCGDFLEERSEGKAYVTSCADLEELLVGEGYWNWENQQNVLDMKNLPFLHLMDDDTEMCLLGNAHSYYEKLQAIYSWERLPFNEKGNPFPDEAWKHFYHTISVANVVLDKLPEFSNESLELRERIEGEALFIRAWNYYYLINLYAKPYSKTTASMDPGVPVKLDPMIEDVFFSRQSVDSVYSLIVSDLEKSVVLLYGGLEETIYQASEAAVHALLGRIYLYMGEYELALVHLEDPVFTSYALVDLSSASLSSSSMEMEVIHTQMVDGGLVSKLSVDFQVSEELYYDMYDPEDQRGKFFFSSTYYGNRICGKSVPSVGALRVAELFLNRAEAYAMLEGQEEKAVENLRALRSKRYVEGTSLEIVDSFKGLTGKELVDFIRQERRRELCFEGHRWFDLRRYAVSPKYPESKMIRHNIYGEGASASEQVLLGYYILDTYDKDNGWVLPIPDYAIEFNDGALENNEREDRTFFEL